MSKEILKEVLDTIYDCYKLDNDMDWQRHTHPMFYNGSFSKDYSPPPKPESLMEKEEFIKWVSTDETIWTKAMEVLMIYISKQRR